MKTRLKRKLKRYLGTIGMGALAGGAVIPVIACSDEQAGQISDDISKLIDELVNDKDDISASTDGKIDNLPAAPEGTRWEYSVNGGPFSPNLPSEMKPDQQIVIKLVSVSDAADVPDNIEIDTTVEEMISVDATSLNRIRIDAQGNTTNAPAIKNTHLEYSIDNGASYAQIVPQGLPIGTSVIVRLVANDGYELSTSLQKVTQVVEEVVISPDFRAAFNGIFANPTKGLQALPIAPLHTHWEYELNDNQGYRSELPALEEWVAGERASVKLVANENYYLANPVVKTILISATQPWAPVSPVSLDQFKSDFKKTRIDANGAVTALPVMPTGYGYRYAVNDGPWVNYDGLRIPGLQGGDIVTFQLQNLGNFAPLANFDYAVSVISFIKTTDLLSALNKLEISTDLGIANLPPAPDHTHWEYKLGNDGDYRTEMPSLEDFVLGEKFTLRLVAAENYLLDNPVTKTVSVAQSWEPVIPVSIDQFNGDFKNTRVDVNGTVTGLPVLPEGYGYRYAVNDGNWETYDGSLINGLTMEDKIVFQLQYLAKPTMVTHFRYELPITSQLKTKNLAAQLKRLTISTDSGLANLPAAPEHTHWEFSSDGQGFSRTEPSTAEIEHTNSLSIRLVCDQNYYLSTPVAVNDLAITHFAKKTDAILAGLLNLHITANDEEIYGLPDPVEHTHWEFRIMNQFGEAEAYTQFSPADFFRRGILKIGQHVRITLVAAPGYQIDHDAIERLVPLEATTVDLSAPSETAGLTVKESLLKGLENIWFSYENEDIAWVPPTPRGTHWEYRLGGVGSFLPEKPRIGPEYYSGETPFILELQLAADTGFVISEPVYWQIGATGIVNTAGYYDLIDKAENNKNSTITYMTDDDDETGTRDASSTSHITYVTYGDQGNSMPDAPAHSRILVNSDPWTKHDPSRLYEPYVYWIEPDEGWIVSEKVLIGKSF